MLDLRTVPVRFSSLKAMARSPMHYRHSVEEGWEQSLAMRMGSAVHAILFGQPYALWSGKVRNGKAWEDFQAQHGETLILNARELAEAQGIAAAVESHSEARRLLIADDLAIERRINWSFMGRDCAGTPDVRAAGYIVDLKTTRCADPERFVRDASFRAYHAQLAWYLDGVIQAGLGTPTEAYIVAVESTPPHPVTVLRLTDNAIDQGRRLCRIWMERLLSCERANHWPGYVEGVVDFDVDVPLDLEFSDDEEHAA
jgi:exodeoxyribonuclease VIII